MVNKERILTYSQWNALTEGNSWTEYAQYRENMIKSIVEEALEKSAEQKDAPEQEWKSLGGNATLTSGGTRSMFITVNSFNGMPTKPKLKRKDVGEYKDRTDVNDGTICETIENRGSIVFKFFIETSRVDHLEKSYSNYGARQLYYNIDKEEEELSFITACSTLLGLQLHMSGIEDKINKEEIEEVNKLNSRTLSLDRERDDEGFTLPSGTKYTFRAGLRDNGKKSLAGQSTSNNNWKLKGTNSNRLQESRDGTSEEPVDEDEQIIKSYWINSTEYIKIQRPVGPAFWVTRDWRNEGFRGPMYIPRDILQLLPSS